MNDEPGSRKQRREDKKHGKCCQPSYEATATRAYDLWLARGATHGHDVEDWLEAEYELRHARRRQRHGAAA